MRAHLIALAATPFLVQTAIAIVPSPSRWASRTQITYGMIEINLLLLISNLIYNFLTQSAQPLQQQSTATEAYSLHPKQTFHNQTLGQSMSQRILL